MKIEENEFRRFIEFYSKFDFSKGFDYSILNKFNKLDPLSRILTVKNKHNVLINTLYNKISQLLNSEDIEILHIHRRLIDLGIQLKENFDVPIILYFNYSPKVLADVHNEKSYLEKIDIFDKIVCPSEFIKLELELFNNDCDILKIPDPVDLSLFHPYVDGSHIRNQLKIHSTEPMVLYVSPLILSKGIEVFLNAIPDILKEYPNSKFMIVGNQGTYTKSDIERVKKLVEDLKIENNLIYGITYSLFDMPQVYAASDIVVSTSPNEAFGYGIVEAMFCKKPIIAVNSGSLSEIIKNSNGILINPGDSEKLSWTIKKLLSDNGLSRQLAENAYHYAREKYDAKVVSQLYYKLYKSMTL